MTWKELISQHFTALLIALGVTAFVILSLSIWLFRDLMTRYAETTRAMRRFAQFVLGLRGAAKGDAAAVRALDETITPGSVKASDVQPPVKP